MSGIPPLGSSPDNFQPNLSDIASRAYSLVSTIQYHLTIITVLHDALQHLDDFPPIARIQLQEQIHDTLGAEWNEINKSLTQLNEIKNQLPLPVQHAVQKLDGTCTNAKPHSPEEINPIKELTQVLIEKLQL
jgi:hypothetical protein